MGVATCSGKLVKPVPVLHNIMENMETAAKLSLYRNLKVCTQRVGVHIHTVLILSHMTRILIST
jgi:hypothetical protein